MSRPVEAITALVRLLDVSPTDAEAWAELSDVYQSQGLYQQAIFCLEEVLLITPNAWNVSQTDMITFEVEISKQFVDRFMPAWVSLSICPSTTTIQAVAVKSSRL